MCAVAVAVAPAVAVAVAVTVAVAVVVVVWRWHGDSHLTHLSALPSSLPSSSGIHVWSMR